MSADWFSDAIKARAKETNNPRLVALASSVQAPGHLDEDASLSHVLRVFDEMTAALQADDREETHHGIFVVWSRIAIMNRGTCPGMTFAIW